MLGKKVLNHVYWHYSLTDAQESEMQQIVKAAEILAHLKPGLDYNVIKYDVSDL